MMNNEFEIAQNYGASAFLVYCFLKQNPGATILDIQIETGLSDNCVKTQVYTLLNSNLLSREKEFLKMSKGYRYSTVIQ